MVAYTVARTPLRSSPARKTFRCPDVVVRSFLDGRNIAASQRYDLPGTLGKFSELGLGRIRLSVAVSGTMDRDKRWERLELAYDALAF